MIIFWSRTGTFSYNCHIVSFFYLTRDRSKDDVSVIQCLLLWDNFFLRNQYQLHSRKITLFLISSVALMLLNYCLNFPETWRYINILFPFSSILNSLSTQLFPQNSFLLLKRSIKKLHSFFCKNNFTWTKAFILAKKIKNKLRTMPGLLLHGT